ncbi:MAG: hypothetical protein FWF10_01065 [Clostridiales bacterium]|nr:hypothetical protein [Clostridiales bacterium]
MKVKAVSAKIIIALLCLLSFFSCGEPTETEKNSGDIEDKDVPSIVPEHEEPQETLSVINGALYIDNDDEMLSWRKAWRSAYAIKRKWHNLKWSMGLLLLSLSEQMLPQS